MEKTSTASEAGSEVSSGAQAGSFPPMEQQVGAEPSCTVCDVEITDKRLSPLVCISCGSLTHIKPCSGLPGHLVSRARPHFKCDNCVSGVKDSSSPHIVEPHCGDVADNCTTDATDGAESCRCGASVDDAQLSGLRSHDVTLSGDAVPAEFIPSAGERQHAAAITPKHNDRSVSNPVRIGTQMAMNEHHSIACRSK